MAQPIAIISALPQELAALRGDLRSAQELRLLPGSACWRGQLEGQEVVLAEAGIGKVAMAMLATLLIERCRPRAVALTGVAGGLDPRLRIGDVVVGERLIQHDAGLAGPDGTLVYQPEHLPFFNPIERLGYEPEPAMVERVMARLRRASLHEIGGRRPKIVRGTIMTGDVFVNSVALRERLFADFRAQAVEMEGGALAQVAERFSVPALVVRALSDLAGSEAPSPEDFGRFLEVASDNSARVVRHLLPVV